MVYITGDMHGDFERFRGLGRLKKGDTLIICGDFGFIWTGSRKEKKILKRIGRFRFNVAFVDGCHENYDLLEKYSAVKWNGGKARAVSGRLVQLMRGQIYEIDGRTFFTFGGGHSPDFDIRNETDTWWERELPTLEEINAAIQRLHDADYHVDYVITHEPPWSLYSCLNTPPPDHLEVHAFFEEVIQHCEFRRWYFGKSHMNKTISAKFRAVFDKISRIK